MTRIGKLWRNRYSAFVVLLLLTEAVIFLICGPGRSYIAVHDNLDLFVPHLRMMSLENAFFSHGDILPILGGVTRDKFGSELSLYNLLYYFFPGFTAYMLGYFLRVIISIASFLLLARDIYGERFAKYKGAVLLTGLACGLLPVFPAYSFAFASIPLVIFLLRRIYREPKLKWYLLLFLYPVLSYFSYFGFFILAYLAAAIVILAVRDKKLSGPLTLALFVLAAGNVIFEYRLFGDMLSGAEVTIRSSMVDTDLGFTEICSTILDVFINGVFHAQGDQSKFILPVCAAYLVIANFLYIKRGQYRRILKDGVNLIVLLILFNCLIYGMYYWGGFRRLFEMLLPPLKGFQFSRTIFFNPFLWHAALFIILTKICDRGKIWLMDLGLLVSVAVVVMTPAVYNDFYQTCYVNAYRIIRNAGTNNLSYSEFYSEELFEKIKKDISYEGEKSVAYGIHPGVLQYNGIFTLDGYLGLYSQDYKEEFRKIIAPALDRVEEWQIYYDEWGARAYIFSGSGENTWNPVKNPEITDEKLYMDPEAFRAMGGTYIFSRIPFDNAGELGINLRGVYQNDASPYSIYVYSAAE